MDIKYIKQGESYISITNDNCSSLPNNGQVVVKSVQLDKNFVQVEQNGKLYDVNPNTLYSHSTVEMILNPWWEPGY